MTGHCIIKKRKRWPGVKQAAADLGVCYGHLLMVIKGLRTSRRMSARYAEWLKRQGGMLTRKEETSSS